ncbi:hypothetical protein Rhopal_003297-T1 [Rhodotorula paludigena]|uniref:Major facilitator superfamily (MFS) profile domain-containing protein n=1 Tax=Rhodotorula paludigena TaxID=86838 RepID=A0AAV5GLZ4_9BASI|nr:hypothetical protein Rhopal_003297-T1 [Rhodotorula paludigena]
MSTTPLDSPRSSASEPLSPEHAAAALSWPPAAPHRADDGLADEDDDEGKLTPALVRIVVVAGLGGLLFGFDTGVTSGALLLIGSDLGGQPLTLAQETGIVVSALWGALGGSLVASRVSDWVGRKPVIIGAAVLFAIGALEQAAAQVYKEIVLGRVMVGLGVGLASMVLPIYLAELSPAKFRGRIVASLVVLITGGQVVAYLINAIFSHVDKGWRWSFGLGAVPALVQLILSFALPESPRHQLRHGRVAPARKTLQRLNPHLTHEAVQRRIERIQTEVGEPLGDGRDTRERMVLGWRARAREWCWTDLRKGRFAQLWQDRANRRALLVAMGLQFFQQATGFNCLISGKIIQSTHLSQPAAFAVFIAVSNFISTLVALRLIDRVGRRLLLLRTLVGMMAGMALLAFAFIFIPSSPPSQGEDAVAAMAVGASPWAFVALVAMVSFCCAYALGIGNAAWVVQSEVFNQDLRAIGNGLSTACNWTANLLVSSTFLYLSKALTPAGAFGFFALVCLGGWIFTWLYLPETKGLSLEEVRERFEEQVGMARPSSRSFGSSEADGLVGRHEEGGGGYYVVGDDEDDLRGDEDESGEEGLSSQRRSDDGRMSEDVREGSREGAQAT